MLSEESKPVNRPLRRLRFTLVAATAAGLLLGGCYSGRAAWGGLRMMAKRRPVARLLADPATDPELAVRLRSARQLVLFAEEQLALPVGRAYDSYVELGRPYATWTVSAAPEVLGPHRPAEQEPARPCSSEIRRRLEHLQRDLDRADARSRPRRGGFYTENGSSGDLLVT